MIIVWFRAHIISCQIGKKHKHRCTQTMRWRFRNALIFRIHFVSDDKWGCTALDTVWRLEVFSARQTDIVDTFGIKANVVLPLFTSNYSTVRAFFTPLEPCNRDCIKQHKSTHIFVSLLRSNDKSLDWLIAFDLSFLYVHVAELLHRISSLSLLDWFTNKKQTCCLFPEWSKKPCTE